MKTTLLLLALLLCTATIGYADDRRGSPFPSDEHWEGSRTWRPDRDRRWRGQELPDRFTMTSAAGVTADPTPTPEQSPTAYVVWREETDTSPGQPTRPVKRARMEAPSSFSGPITYPTLEACQAAIAQMVERQRAMLARYPVMRGGQPMYTMHEDGYTQQASIGLNTVLETRVTWSCAPYVPRTQRSGGTVDPWGLPR